MNFIKRIKMWMAYKWYLMKYDEVRERMKYCLEGTTDYVTLTYMAMRYLDLAIEYKEKLDT